ncbi:MAG: DUF4411 family protein [Chloroflexota bacterium]
MVELFKEKTYCLDSNVFIEGWNKYYSPQLCPDYWNVLKELGRKGKIFIPKDVYEEITSGEDELSSWLKSSKIRVSKRTGPILNCWTAILAKNPNHQRLVDNTKGRSLADPWVIAHAIVEKATVVTKEIKLLDENSKRLKIPNVCENMGVPWMDDFQFLKEVNALFSCKIKPSEPIGDAMISEPLSDYNAG